METPSYRGFRFPPEVISHCVSLYHRFALSLRDVEELMLERGIEVSYETIHQWTRRFGPTYADGNVLDILVQNRRDEAAARRFVRTLMKKTHSAPRVIVTDKLRFLRRRPPPRDALGRAPLAPGPEQPGRELPPADQAARTRLNL